MCLGLALAWRGVRRGLVLSSRCRCVSRVGFGLGGSQGGLVLRRVYGSDSSLVNKIVTKTFAFIYAYIYIYNQFIYQIDASK